VRVVVVAEWYPSAADPVHGIWAHRQALAAKNHGAELRVLALRRPVPPLSVLRQTARLPPRARPLIEWGAGAARALRTERRDGLKVAPVPWLAPPRPLSYGTWGWWMAPPLGRALDRLRAEWPFDVLHAHCLAPTGHAAARWMQRHGGRDRPALVVSAHGPDMIHVPQRSAAGRLACSQALRLSDLVLANSRWASERCVALGADPSAVRVVHLGAHPSTAPLRRAPEPTIVTCAHLHARKHHATVLRALAQMAPERRPRYLVIGDGEQRRELERLTGALGLADRVDFLGQLPNDEAVRLVASCDLFVMPGVEEPFGVAFVEAMGAGVPAVGGRGEGGPQDIAAAGEGIVLVAPGDVGELRRELERLLADRPSLWRLGEAARATVRASFTWALCGERTVAAYREAIERARRPR